MKRIVSSILFFFITIPLTFGQEAKVMEVERDTVVVIPIKHLPTINGVFEENDLLKEEIKLKDELIRLDSLALGYKDLQLDSWARQEDLWKDSLKSEKKKRTKSIVGSSVLGIIVGLLVGIFL